MVYKREKTFDTLHDINDNIVVIDNLLNVIFKSSSSVVISLSLKFWAYSV